MTAQFLFALQPLLEARERVERERLAIFAARRHAVEQCRREFERLANARARITNLLVDAGRTGRTSEARLYDADLRSLVRTIERAQRRCAQLEAECEIAGKALATARRERRVIERLKERRRHAFELEEARREELEIDEANARRSGKATA